jgi:hypothetical protein
MTVTAYVIAPAASQPRITGRVIGYLRPNPKRSCGCVCEERHDGAFVAHPCSPAHAEWLAERTQKVAKKMSIEWCVEEEAI